MTDIQSDHAAISNSVNTYYEKKILKDFEPSTVFYSSAPIKQEVPRGGGNSVEFTRYQKIAALYSDNTDEFTAQQMYQSTQVITATLRERDGYVQLSRFADLTMIGGGLDRVADKVKAAAAKTLDKLVRNDIGMAVIDVAASSSVAMNNLNIDGGTLNHSGITVRVWSHGGATPGDRFPMYHNKTRVAQSSLVSSFASSAMTLKTLLHGVQVLVNNDADPLADGKYCFICHPTVAYQLFISAGYKGWFSPTSNEAKGDPTQLGVLGNVRIKTSTLAYRYPLTGDTLYTSSGALFCSLLFGAEAYGVSEIGQKGFKFYLKQSGPTTVSDPTNMKKQAGFTVRGVARVLNKSAGIWIMTTEN